MADVSIILVKDEATPALRELAGLATAPSTIRRMASACTTLTKNHLIAQEPNKMGWPTTGFYVAIAKNASWYAVPRGFVINLSHPTKPGAMQQRYYGGPIVKKDKLLTIPARAEFYGQKATDFTGLRFVMFGRGGPKALVIGGAGTYRLDVASGTERRVKGAGKKMAGRVAFWLRDRVFQEGDTDIIPNDKTYTDTIEQVLMVQFLHVKRGGKLD